MTPLPPSTSDEAAIQRLAELATDASLPPKAARFRRLYPAIERALSNGIPHKAVVENLEGSGLVLTPKLFSKYLLLERRRRATLGQAAPDSENPHAPGGTRAQAPSPVPEYGAHDPRRLDAIINKPVNLDELAKLAKKGKP